VRLISPEMEKAYTNGDNAGNDDDGYDEEHGAFYVQLLFRKGGVVSPNFHRVRCVCELTRFFSLFLSLSLEHALFND